MMISNNTNFQFNFIILYVLQLLFFLVYIYFIAFLGLKYRIRLYFYDFILMALQAFLFVVFIMYNNSEDWIMRIMAVENNIRLNYAVQCALLFTLLLRFTWLLKKAPLRRCEMLTPLSVREAIDFMPRGICFSTRDGKPILANRKINELIYMLTNKTIMDVHRVWDELQLANFANRCIKLDDDVGISCDGSYSGGGSCSNTGASDILVMLPDKSIWKFRKEVLSDKAPYFIQLDAIEITDLYNYSKKLFDNKNRLTEQYARQQNLLANIVGINREKEILSIKMRIHDDFGQSILVTRKHMTGGTIADNSMLLVDLWRDTIKRIEDCAHIYAHEKISPEVELRRAADIIGCSIDIQGERPSQRKASLLFYIAVREALTNAVIHANADRLTVRIERTEYGHHVVISDNGSLKNATIIEGNGLGNLRKKLEQEGAALRIKCEVNSSRSESGNIEIVNDKIDKGVILEIDIPS